MIQWSVGQLAAYVFSKLPESQTVILCNLAAKQDAEGVQNNTIHLCDNKKPFVTYSVMSFSYFEKWPYKEPDNTNIYVLLNVIIIIIIIIIYLQYRLDCDKNVAAENC